MDVMNFALAGNPNSGKTTLFNALTGSTAHVGNWPGVTVDKKEGVYKKGSEPVSIIDLPGIYSLSPYTPEEVIARNYILDERPACIINIVDATNLERNLYLTTQLLEVDIPMVVALNMTDVLEKKGDDIDEKTLEKRLGVPVVEISALREKGIDVLMERAIEAANTPRQATSVLKGAALYGAIENAEIAFKLNGVTSPLFHAVKLVERDELEVKAHPAEAKAAEDFLAKSSHAENEFGGDTEAEIADARYRYISANFSTTLKRGKEVKRGELSKSDKVDKVLTNKWAGIPIFLVILFAVFHVTFSENFLYLGSIIPAFGDWCEGIAAMENPWLSIFFSGEGFNSPGAILFYLMDACTATVGEWINLGLTNAGAASWAIGLVCDGIWGGIAAVLSFVPQILVLFLCFSILEDSGYMARVAFILDRIFRRFGVSGRAFMPMIMGFGCSIPAMINTRTLADEKERTATVRVIPFFSCGAKAPILTAIAGAIIAMGTGVQSEDLIVFSMYLLGMVVAIISLLLMRSTTMRGETPPFVMELPAYHMPRFKNLMIHLWDKLKHYVKKAFTIILVSCIVIWVLSNFSWNWTFLIKDCVEYVELDSGVLMSLEQWLAANPGMEWEGNVLLMHATEWSALGYVLPGELVAANISMNESILGSIGMLIQPIFTPLGFGSQLGAWGWVFAVAAITGLIAKENVIATFGSLAACIAGGIIASETGVEEVGAMITATNISVPALISFIMFNMTTIPCFAAVASAKGELGKGKFKWTLVFWLVASYLVGCIVYTIGAWWWTAFIWAAVVALTVVGIVLYNKKADKKAALLK
ncbi:MAG: ferrous iron transport protein B [Clostridia bacterium]|nr:ferrous iron transport protein B [Clostridia bacterium]